MIQLIINADDFGLTKGINKGILKAYTNGIVTSTTIMINSEEIEDAIMISKSCPSLSVGLHLTITSGKSLTTCPSLTDKEGNFLKTNKDTLVNQEELYKEWKAQIEKYIKLFNHLPTHLDSHHHSHLSNQDVILTLAREFNLPVRGLHTPDYPDIKFIPGFTGKNLSIKFLNQHIQNDGIYELMVHPGICDEHLKSISSHNIQREEELAYLCSEDLQKWIKVRDIKLRSYKDF